MTVRDVRDLRLSVFIGDGLYLNNGGNGYPGDGWVRLYFGNGNPTPFMMNGTDVAIDGVLSAATITGAMPDVQPISVPLTALSSVAPAADLLPYFTDVDTASTTAFTSFARTLLAGASAAAMRTTLAAAPSARTISAGTGLTGGGDLSADRTLSLADTAVTPASYGSASTVGTFTVDQQGRLIAAGTATITPAAIGAVATNGDGSAVTVDGTQALGTIFVPAGADIPVTVGASGADYTTLAAAWSAISRWVIPDTAWVTISVAAGTYTSSSAISLKHPYGHRIRINGPSAVSTSATASGAVSGSAGAWSVPLTVTSSAGMAVGDYVLIRPTAGTGQWRLFGGICKISAVTDGTHITVTNTARNAAWPTAALTTATVTALKATLSFTGCDGLQVDGPVGSIDRLAIVGDKTAGTIGLIAQRAQQGGKGKAYVYLGTSVGITSFGDGGVYAQYNGTVDAASLCVADCLTYNVLAQHGGSVMLNSGIISGGVEAGVAASQNGAVSFENGIACGNGTYGVFAFGGGAILAKDGYMWSNVAHGAYAAYGGVIRADNLNCQYNGQDGIFAVDGAAVVVPNGVASNNTLMGVHAEGGAAIYYSGGVANSNGSSGFYADGGNIECPSATATTNTVNGFTAINAGVILGDSSNGSGNTANSYSASKNGFIRATNATGTALIVSDGGMIDYTGGTGSPTLTRSGGGAAIITGSGTVYGDISLGALTATGITLNGSLLSTGRMAIGATNAAAFNIELTSAVYHRLVRNGTLGTIFGIDDGGTLVVGAAAGDSVFRAQANLWLTAGGANPRVEVKTTGQMRLMPLSAAPSGAEDGDMYYNSSTGKFQGRASGAWVDLN